VEEALLRKEDLHQIKEHGLTREQVQKQLQLFKKSQLHLELLRPCTPGDGIEKLDHEKRRALIRLFDRERAKGRCLKFVPASGAASRMFRTPLLFLHQDGEITRESVSGKAEAGDGEARELLAFMEGIKKFAFYGELRSIMREKGLSIDILLDRGQFTEILRFLLEDDGLGYGNLPKALLSFHAYPGGARTAFEEHLVEAASYVKDQSGHCHLHMTVSEEHLENFLELFTRVRPEYEEKYGVFFHVTFSLQDKSTDTLAVTLDHQPFREKDGRLLFRPGGHGALLANLNHLQGDIVFIKNIDNVLPDRLKPETIEWKKTLGGYLVGIQTKIFHYLENLSSGDFTESVLEEAVNFARDEILLPVPDSFDRASPPQKATLLAQMLNRPVRVCGMVRNVGEPGGGPFLVKNRQGIPSRQIVEKAQVNPHSKSQQAVWASATHFNPVDLVCGVRDWQGKPFDLRKYVDPDAVFISTKSKDGRDLKALEHPGLWNGSMAHWISIFVETPITTFSPIKTVVDLLREEHQETPGGRGA